MYKYCERNDLPHERVGKLIVATRERELPVLEDLHQRATANGVQGLELLSPKQITDLEPNVRALRALHSPNTGIANYARIALSYADDFLRNGRGQIRTGYKFLFIQPFYALQIDSRNIALNFDLRFLSHFMHTTSSACLSNFVVRIDCDAVVKYFILEQVFKVRIEPCCTEW